MKKAAAPAKKSLPEQTPNPSKDFFEVRIPRLKFRDTPINVFLVMTLVVFAFFLGMLTDKVLFLEKAVQSAPSPTSQTADTLSPVPTVPQVVKVDPGKLPVLGNKDAKVTVVEFSDFECPYCAQYFNNTMKQLDEAYIQTGKIKFAFRHYPLTNIHQLAAKAGEAAECANEQDNFWAYHDKLFTEQSSWSSQTSDTVTGTFTEYAGQLGLDTTQFQSCVESSKYAGRVTEDLEAGQKVQVDGTPTFFVNGYRVVGAVPFSELQKVIEQELQKVK